MICLLFDVKAICVLVQYLEVGESQMDPGIEFEITGEFGASEETEESEDEKGID